MTERRHGQRGALGRFGQRMSIGRRKSDPALDILSRPRDVKPDKPEIPEGKKIVGGMILPDFSRKQKPVGAPLKRQARSAGEIERSRRRRARNVARARRHALRPKRKHGRQVRVR